MFTYKGEEFDLEKWLFEFSNRAIDTSEELIEILTKTCPSTTSDITIAVAHELQDEFRALRYGIGSMSITSLTGIMNEYNEAMNTFSIEIEQATEALDNETEPIEGFIAGRDMGAQAFKNLYSSLDSIRTRLQSAKDTQPLDRFASLVGSRPAEFWEFPYTEGYVEEFTERLAWSMFIDNDSPLLPGQRRTADKLSNGNWDRYIQAGKQVPAHFDLLFAQVDDATTNMSAATNAEKFMYLVSFVTVAGAEELKALISGNKQEVIYQGTIKPTKRHDPIHKAAQAIMGHVQGVKGHDLYGMGLSLSVSKHKNVETMFALEFVPDDEFKLSKPLDAFDNEVLNSATSLWLAGNDRFTANQVAQVVYGSDKPTPAQTAEATESIEKLIRTRVKLDFSAEAKAHGLKDENGEPIEKSTYDDWALDAAHVQMVSVNGKVVDGYMMKGLGPLYLYALANKQLITYPVKYLDTKGVGNTNRENVLIKSYLIMRIEQIKNNRNMNRHIRYDTIFEHAGITSERTREGKRAYISRLLNKWQKDGMFKKWGVHTEGPKKKKVSVVITP